MKTIYDEVIENLRSVMAKFIIPNVEDTDYGCLYDLCHFYNTLDDEENKWLRSVYKTLERAKKVEEELKYTKEQFDKYWKEVCILKPKLSKVEELVKSYEVLVHDYEQLLETKDSKEWSLLRFHIIELKRIIDKRVEELK